MRRLTGVAAAIALAGIAAPAAEAAPVPGLPPEALTVMNQPAYRHSQWNIAVRDAATGAPVISLNADVLAQPGSANDDVGKVAASIQGAY
ncbi:hypothetical protein Q5424_15550 [Conexibacter sp. JD483]|uniref:hypothetical protein n=1 Tax=unclassified Conexibacter TaxID=2627773 RepID=UPI00271F0B50|nr:MULTISPECIES: hypothetical protein [unclassified Conexibacter]MDO8185693.1 hypothetical protein [Conexibacter sp. CPCC 205706]MDO8199070.1 hypothetical protein [Conexibacter sp. CPCC 205762]MDR9370511.1 hypothetical protein [Conexibacter sp. JD483]